MTLVLRGEMLQLARNHTIYARKPAIHEQIERLAIIRPGKFLLNCIRSKAQRQLQRKVGSPEEELALLFGRTLIFLFSPFLSSHHLNARLLACRLRTIRRRQQQSNASRSLPA